MEGTYTIQCECSNCDYKGTVELQKGTPCNGNQDCPNCGCKTAQKIRKPVMRGPVDGDGFPKWPQSPKRILCGTLKTSGELAQATIQN